LAELPAVIAELDLELLREMLTQAVSEIDGADREVGEVLVEELSEPDQIRLLLDHAPADVLAAVERAADRVGLRAEYDTAVTAAGPTPHCARTATD
jgi:hypothetical protein